MLNHIPLELRSLRQWVTAGADKVPLTPRTKQAADVNNPLTWGSFEEACSSGLPHVGFVLSNSDPYTIVDLDAPQSAEQAERHTKIYNALESYAELSQSGQGVHIICRGTIPQGVRRDRVEVYSSARYMICTGKALRNLGIEDCQPVLDVLFREMHGQTNGAGVHLGDYQPLLSDRDLVEMASSALNGEKFDSLCRGEWEGIYESQSEADYALLSILAFYSPSNEQVMRVFRMSELGKREKAWRTDYLPRCIGRIRAQQPEPIDFSKFQVLHPTPNPTPENQNAERIGDSAPFVSNGTVDDVPNHTAQPTPSALPARGSVSDFPPGLVGELARYIYDTSSRPVVEVATCAAIALMAGIVGRQYNISGTGLNQYIILLAKTGIGKEEGIKGIDRLMTPLRTLIPSVDTFIGPGTFASGQAMIRTLDEKPCFVSVIGEVGLMLRTLSDPNANERSLVMRRILLDLYGKSGQKSLLRSSAYADREKNTKLIASPAMTLFGESTPETFYEGLNLSQVADGLIPRFLIVEYTGDRPRRNKHPFTPPPQELLDKFATVVTTAMQMQVNNAWYEVRIDAEAQADLDGFDKFCDEQIRGAGQEGIRQLWNRAHLKALKLSGVLAVATHPHDPVVHREESSWAIRLVRTDAERIVNRFATGDVGEGESKQTADVKRIIRDYLESSPAMLKKYKVEEELHAARVIPKGYLQIRTSGLSAFKNHRTGARNALDATLTELMEDEVLSEVPKKQLQEKFGTGRRCYLIHIK